MNYQSQVTELFDLMKETRTNDETITEVVSYFVNLQNNCELPFFPTETELRERLTWYSQREWFQQASKIFRRLVKTYNVHFKLDVDSEMNGYAYLATATGTLYLHEEKCKELDAELIEAILTHEMLHVMIARHA